ncbi:serine protease Do [Azospirillum fermentarium]|uniref:Do family serine endopeptidase n=1 Tax=Azospirillum fermentarium TaxID=1233114 RepID=UPI002227E116|nr:Do family serine endopeptidase [Azospirillum fermentarium]MCW2248361.1 serine protease Do [Azospirillum fermentarium]
MTFDKAPFLRRSGLVFALTLAGFLSASPIRAEPEGVVPAAPAPALPVPSFSTVVKTQLPAVVNVMTEGKTGPRPSKGDGAPPFPQGSPFNDFFRDLHRNTPPDGGGSGAVLGTGFVIDSGGWVVTNYHVVADAGGISVVFQDGGRRPARLAGADPATDLAVLKVDADRPLTAVEWGDSDGASVGDWVLAIGNPFGLGGTVTAGILSARARDIQQGPYDEYLQTDAPINRGNSGGPLFNLDGKVIGINAAIYSPTGGSVGIAFAIPSNLARPVIDQLREHGAVRRGWLGVQVQDLTPELAEGMGMAGTTGALVAAVTPGGPAERGGVRRGDVITAFGPSAIDSMRALPKAVSQAGIGTILDVRLLRRGKAQSVKVTIGALPEVTAVALGSTGTSQQPSGASDTPAEPPLGLVMATISPRLRVAYGIERSVEGVVVTEVRGGGAAEAQGIEVGDVILEAGQHPVGKPEDVMARLHDARGQGRHSLPLFISRQGDLRYVAVPVPSAG